VQDTGVGERRAMAVVNSQEISGLYPVACFRNTSILALFKNVSILFKT